MSQQEKENFISLATTIAVSIPALIYLVQRYQEENFTTEEELKFWATALLILIPIRIVSQIVMYILFSIGRAIITGKDEEESSIVDERDRLIELKGTRNAHYVFMVGVMLSMSALAIGQSPTVMFGVLFVSGFVSELTEIGSKAYFYRKGV